MENETDIKTQETKAETNNEVTNELTLVDEMNRNNKQTYCSITGTGTQERKQIYNALSKCDYRVADMLNKPISLKDVIIQKYTHIDDETGEVTEKKRIVLFDNEGKTYASASNGLYNSLLRLFAIIGMPTSWDAPINIQVQETTTKKGQKTYEIVIL